MVSKTDERIAGEVDLQEIQDAEKEIIKSVQEQYFGNEMKLMKEKKNLHAQSSIFKLDAYLDEELILRVGGRIKQSMACKEIQHPILIPKNSKVAELIIRWCHDKVGHARRGMTINEIRCSGFWIVNCNGMVKSFISRCVRCKVLRGKVQQQKMADLPEDRLSEGPPFSYCGIDMFGLFW